jgi:GAF domain-containing protein
MHAVPNQLRRMATVLATTAAPGVALREYFSEATALLPFHRVRLVVPISPERAAIIVPGDARPLADMPSTVLGPGLVRRVLHGEAPHGAAQGGNEVDLVFPMRCAGRIVAAMILTTGTPGAFTKAHLALAQQVADGAAWAVASELPARSALTA